MIKIPFLSQQSGQEKQQWVDVLNQAIPEAEIVEADALSSGEKNAVTCAIVANPSQEDVRSFPNLVWVQSLWAGVEGLVRTLPEHIALVRLVDPQLAETMAEAVLAWTLYLQRKMPQYARQQQNNVWQQLPVKTAAQTRISILGAGELGLAALDCLSKFNYQLKYWSRTNRHLDGIEHFQNETGLKQMMADTDILISLLPLTEDTYHLLNDKTLSWLPKGAQLINFSRGAIIDTSSLLSLIAKGSIEHAVLDVFDHEPLPKKSELWHNQNITILPHISAPTNIDTASKIVAQNITQYLSNGQIPQLVDKARGY